MYKFLLTYKLSSKKLEILMFCFAKSLPVWNINDKFGKIYKNLKKFFKDSICNPLLLKGIRGTLKFSYINFCAVSS